jgi:hypothetical protein
MFSNLSASFLRDGHAIIGDSRGAEAFVEYHVAAFGAQCDFYGVGEDVHAAQHALPTVNAEPNFLGSQVV